MKRFLGVLFSIMLFAGPVCAEFVQGAFSGPPNILEADLEVGTNSIDGDASAGLGFDPDNDGVNEVIMKADGNVGIGTATPATKFHVQDVSTGYSWSPTSGTVAIFENARNNRAFVTITGKSTGQSELLLGDENTQSNARIRYENDTGTLEIWGRAASPDIAIAHTTGDISIGDSGASPIMFVDRDPGNVGIGTIVPAGKLSIGGQSGSQFNIKTITELVTIPVGSGLTPVVVTSGNLAPAGSLIMGVVFRVTDAPGGGATTIDIGRTGGGNLDEFIDGASCDVLNETGTNYINGDAAHTGIQRNVTADTLTLTTDADVTGDDAIIRIVVFYRDLTAPTS